MPGPYKIGEAAALLDLKTYVLRFWETEFPQIAPMRTETGRRVYTDEHLALLERIRFLLYDHGLTIEGARRVLNEEAAKGVRYAPPAALERASGEEVSDSAPSGRPVPELSMPESPVLAPTTPVEPALTGAAENGGPSEKDDTSASDREFWREIRIELEKVAVLLGAPAPQGDRQP